MRAARREWWLRAARSQYAGLDPEDVGRAVAHELASGPLRQKELSRRLNERAGGGPQAGINILADIVRVPPSGTWDQRRADLYGLAADWLKPPKQLTERDGMELLIRRYLGGFGPAGLADVANWMGINISTTKEVAATMELLTFSDESGRTLVDLPDAPLPDPDTPAPARLLPIWDATLLVHARRTLILPGGVPIAGLQHQNAALGQHLPARRPSGRRVALRQGGHQPRALSDPDPRRARIGRRRGASARGLPSSMTP